MKIKHGHSGSWAKREKPSRTYLSWVAMRRRCLKKYCHAYKRYGAKGVTICKRWEKFENFLEDMGVCPSGLTLDRYPNRKGNYCKSNCRWATPNQQARNRNNTIFVKCLGVTMSASDAEEQLGFPYGFIGNFVRRNKGFDGDVSQISHHTREKLNKDDVLRIRQCIDSGPVLAAQYGVTRELIYAIRKRKIWRCVQ